MAADRRRASPSIATGLAVVCLALGVPSLRAQQPASFPTVDGGVVFADVYGVGPDAVVLAHGGRFTKESWSHQAGRLEAEGFLVVAIDFRGRGRSVGGPGSTEDDVFHDVLAVVRHLRAVGARTVSVVGASFGGWAAATAAVEAGPGVIDRLVLLAATPIDEPERLPGRKLFILARDDVQGEGVPRLPAIAEQYERTPGPKDLVLLDGSAHAQFLFDTPHRDRVMDEIVAFLTAR